MSSETKASPRRIPELDGLRAIAILAVLVLHFRVETGLLKWTSPISDIGWVGVDLFFVLSGYLITGILLDSVGKRHFYRNFVIRRALRILPLYYACVVAFTIAVFLNAEHWRGFIGWGGPSWFVFYIANIRAAFLNRLPPAQAFVPFWSLQVEEQFYLLYPFLIAVCSAKTLRRVLIGSVVAAPIFRCATLLILPGNDVAQLVLTPLRMDSLALGGLVSLLYREGKLPSARSLFWMCAMGSSACAAMFLFVSVSVFHPMLRSVGYSIVDVTCACVLAFLVTSPASAFARVMRWRPAVYTGQIAYGLYLLHGPASWGARAILSRFLRIDETGSLNLIISFAASFLAAALSWKFFESFFLGIKDRFTFDDISLGIEKNSDTDDARLFHAAQIQTTKP